MARPESKLITLKERQDRYVKAVAKLGTITSGCRAIRASRTTILAWRVEDQDDGYSAQEFTRREKEAFEEFLDTLEAEAARRAYKGVPKGVYHLGVKVAQEHQYSDTLLMFLLNGGRPEKFRQRVDNTHSAPGGGPVQQVITHRFTGMTDEELEAFVRGGADSKPVPEGGG